MNKDSDFTGFFLCLVTFCKWVAICILAPMFCLGRFLILSFMASGNRKKKYVNEDSDFTAFF